MDFIKGFFIAFSMYSKLPMPRVDWTKQSMKYSMCFFPLVGVVIGTLVLLWDRLAGSLLHGSPLYTAVLVLIPVAVSGGIHLDGLLDTADALSSYKSMEEKLEILKDSHAGAFAIIIGICYFILYFGFYSEVTTVSLQILAIGFVLSRALSGLAVVSFRLAKNTGLAAAFSDTAVKKIVRVIMAIYILICGALMIWVNLVLGLAGVVGAALCFAWYRFMSYRKFGGITGDLAGFFLQICELVMAGCVIGTELICKGNGFTY